MRTIYLLPFFLILACLVVGCGQAYQMDYGKPAAQFLQEDVARKGKGWVGKKITVKGTVTRIEGEDPESAWIHLGKGIRCNFGKFKAMAESAKVGETVYVDGFLRRCGEGDVLIEPAMLRDSKAPFSPE